MAALKRATRLLVGVLFAASLQACSNALERTQFDARISGRKILSGPDDVSKLTTEYFSKAPAPQPGSDEPSRLTRESFAKVPATKSQEEGTNMNDYRGPVQPNPPIHINPPAQSLYEKIMCGKTPCPPPPRGHGHGHAPAPSPVRGVVGEDPNQYCSRSNCFSGRKCERIPDDQDTNSNHFSSENFDYPEPGPSPTSNNHDYPPPSAVYENINRGGSLPPP